MENVSKNVINVNLCLEYDLNMVNWWLYLKVRCDYVIYSCGHFSTRIFHKLAYWTVADNLIILIVWNMIF